MPGSRAQGQRALRDQVGVVRLSKVLKSESVWEILSQILYCCISDYITGVVQYVSVYSPWEAT